MYSFEYYTQGSCMEGFRYIVEGNNVLDVTVLGKGGCPGQKVVLCNTAMMIKDIDKIVELWGNIACSGSESKPKTSCSQQFCIGLLLYKKMMLGGNLTEEQQSRIKNFKQIENEKEEMERIQNKLTKRLKSNNKLI